jgi:hypothetical protein
MSVAICGTIGLVDSFVAGSLFGLATIFPPRYITGLMAGNGVSGLVITILRMIFKVSLPTDERGTRISTYIYFVVSIIVCLAGIAAYIYWIDGAPITSHYLNLAERDRSRANDLQDSHAQVCIFLFQKSP